MSNYEDLSIRQLESVLMKKACDQNQIFSKQFNREVIRYLEDLICKKEKEGKKNDSSRD